MARANGKRSVDSPDNASLALASAGATGGNKGAEAAQAAVEQVALYRALNQD